MPALRSLAPFFVFAAGYAVIALAITNSYYQLMMTYSSPTYGWKG